MSRIVELQMIFFLSSIFSVCSIAQVSQNQAAQIDKMLGEKALGFCERQSQEITARFHKDPKRIAEFVDQKIIKVTCSFYYKEQVQKCAKAFLAGMNKINATTEDKIREQARPVQAELNSCLRRTEVEMTNLLEKASTDKATADALMTSAMKKIDERTR